MKVSRRVSVKRSLRVSFTTRVSERIPVIWFRSGLLPVFLSGYSFRVLVKVLSLRVSFDKGFCSMRVSMDQEFYSIRI